MFPTVFLLLHLTLLQISAVSCLDSDELTVSPGMDTFLWSFKSQYSTQGNGCLLWEVRRGIVWAG